MTGQLQTHVGTHLLVDIFPADLPPGEIANPVGPGVHLSSFFDDDQMAMHQLDDASCVRVGLLLSGLHVQVDWVLKAHRRRPDQAVGSSKVAVLLIPNTMLQQSLRYRLLST